MVTSLFYCNMTGIIYLRFTWLYIKAVFWVLLLCQFVKWHPWSVHPVRSLIWLAWRFQVLTRLPIIGCGVEENLWRFHIFSLYHSLLFVSLCQPCVSNLYVWISDATELRKYCEKLFMFEHLTVKKYRYVSSCFILDDTTCFDLHIIERFSNGTFW